MIELINTTVQTVPAGQSVVYNATAVGSSCGRERHREGSAFVTLLPPGRYLVSFSANIAVPAGETVGEISLGITQDGEVLGGSLMRVTPAAVEQYFNVSTQHYVDTYRSCCVNVGVENTSGIPILVDNPNITVDDTNNKNVRVCG